MPLLSSTCVTYTAHHILLDFITRTILGEEYRLSSSLCSLLHSPLTSSLLGPNILLSILFSNTLILRSSLNVSDQVSHPYKTKAKIIVLYILIFKSFDLKLKDSISTSINNSQDGLFSEVLPIKQEACTLNTFVYSWVDACQLVTPVYAMKVCGVVEV